MWGKNVSSPFQAGAGETTYIAADCEFSGKLILKGNARIDGKMDGTVEINGDLVIGPSAVLKATIQANTVSISGVVHGEITAKNSLELCASSRLYGDIYTQQLKIDQGAQFIGTSRLLGETKEISKETSKEISKETFEETFEETPKENPKETLKKTTEEMLKDILYISQEETLETALENTETQGNAARFAKHPKSKRR